MHIFDDFSWRSDLSVALFLERTLVGKVRNSMVNKGRPATAVQQLVCAFVNIVTWIQH